jgi:hypothetical protein
MGQTRKIAPQVFSSQTMTPAVRSDSIPPNKVADSLPSEVTDIVRILARIVVEEFFQNRAVQEGSSKKCPSQIDDIN